MKRLLFTAYFLEAGLLLILLPWSTFWDRNYFAAFVPELRPVIGNAFVRGAVSGLGVLNLYAGFGELFALIMTVTRRPGDGPAPRDSSPAPLRPGAPEAAGSYQLDAFTNRRFNSLPDHRSSSPATDRPE